MVRTEGDPSFSKEHPLLTLNDNSSSQRDLDHNTRDGCFRPKH